MICVFAWLYAAPNTLTRRLFGGQRNALQVTVKQRKKKGKLTLWPDSSANDYLSRSKLLENYCAFEMATDFEKKYNTYKEADKMLAAAKQGKIIKYKTLDMDDKMICENNTTSQKSIRDISTYTYLKRHKHIVMLKVSMKEGMLCNIADLALDKCLPSESVLVCWGNYAKQALMMFYPHRTIADLTLNGGFWSKFVQVAGLTPYAPNVNVMDNNCLRESK